MRLNTTLLFGAVALFCSLLSADAVTIYGAAAFGGGASTLYTIDPNTGTATPVGAGIGYDRVGGIDFNPSTGILYGVGANPTTNTFDLITINTMTGLATTVGDTGLGFAFQDIDFRSDGTLWAYAGGGNIYTLNLTTGAASLVGFIGGFGNPPGTGNALAFNPSDTLYRLSGADIYTISQSDGVATDTGTNVNYDATLVNPRTNAMDYDLTTGILYASVTSGAQGDRPAPTHNIAQIDLSNGNFSNSHLTVLGLDALAVQPAQPTPPNGNGVPEPMSTLWLLPILIGLFAFRRFEAQKGSHRLIDSHAQ
jgi:hypothetical protein